MSSVSVYVITSGKYVKIGISRDPERRAVSLRTGNPERPKVFYVKKFPDAKAARSVERRAHALLRDYHQSGEWFTCSPERARLIVSKVKVGAKTLVPRVVLPSKVLTPTDSIDDVLREIAREKIRKTLGWTGDFPVFV